MFPVHPREIERIEALDALDLAATGSEPDLDAICETAAALFGTPIALVSLVGEDEQWFKAKCGLAAGGTPRAVSFCTYAILTDDVFVVEDAARDPRFADNPLVTGEPHIRFYAGAPLLVGPGLQLGSLCVIDHVPRRFSPEQRGQLRNLARIAAAQLRLHRTERDLREREARYRLLADHSTDMIVRSDRDGTRCYVSPACGPLLGFTPEELVGTHPLDGVHPDDAPAYRRSLRDLASARVDRAVEQVRYRRKDGSWIWVEATFSLTRDAATGRPDGYVANVRDISRRKDAELRLAHLAQHDPLTGLPNRLCFRERLEAAVARTRRGADSFALLYLDLDRFKAINDTLGHGAGDAVLREVARRLRAGVRAGDMVARLGGDEFVIIQRATGGPQGTTRLAERLIAAMAAPIDCDGHSARIGISIGAVCVSGGDLDPDALCVRADEALYRAKAAGRNTFRLGDPVVAADRPAPPCATGTPQRAAGSS